MSDLPQSFDAVGPKQSWNIFIFLYRSTEKVWFVSGFFFFFQIYSYNTLKKLLKSVKYESMILYWTTKWVRNYLGTVTEIRMFILSRKTQDTVCSKAFKQEDCSTAGWYLAEEAWWYVHIFILYINIWQRTTICSQCVYHQC